MPSLKNGDEVAGEIRRTFAIRKRDEPLKGRITTTYNAAKNSDKLDPRPELVVGDDKLTRKKAKLLTKARQLAAIAVEAGDDVSLMRAERRLQKVYETIGAPEEAADIYTQQDMKAFASAKTSFDMITEMSRAGRIGLANKVLAKRDLPGGNGRPV